MCLASAHETNEWLAFHVITELCQCDIEGNGKIAKRQSLYLGRSQPRAFSRTAALSALIHPTLSFKPHEPCDLRHWLTVRLNAIG